MKTYTTDDHILTCACGWSGPAKDAWTHYDRRLQTQNNALTDWLQAERDYLLQRDSQGHLPAKQVWHLDTIERRAYEIYKQRTQPHS